MFLKPTYLLENKGPAHEDQSSVIIGGSTAKSKLLDQVLLTQQGFSSVSSTDDQDQIEAGESFFPKSPRYF